MKNKDSLTKLFLEIIPVAGITMALRAIKRGAMRRGNFADCLMHFLSFNGGTYRVWSRHHLLPWIRELVADSDKAQSYVQICKRLIRAFDNAGPAEQIMLPSYQTKQDYYDKAYPDPGFSLTDEAIVQLLTDELDRRGIQLSDPGDAERNPQLDPVGVEPPLDNRLNTLALQLGLGCPDHKH